MARSYNMNTIRYMQDGSKVISFHGGQSQTITLPLAGQWNVSAPVGTIAQMVSGDEAVTTGMVDTEYVIFDGSNWIPVMPRKAVIEEMSSDEIVKLMENIESLFKVTKELGIDSRGGGLIPLEDRAWEYNRCEEELIKRGVIHGVHRKESV